MNFLSEQNYSKFAQRCLTFACFLGSALLATAEDIYIAQNAQGGDTGANAANAHSLVWLNTAANWGAGTTLVSPGDTVHLTGTFTSSLVIAGNGSAGSPVTILFEAGASFSAPLWGVAGLSAIYATNKSYITIDGAGTGVVENTANGTALANQQLSAGVWFEGGTDVTIKRLTVRNIYVRTPVSNDPVGSTGLSIRGIFMGSVSNVLVDSCVVSDAKFGIFADMTGVSGVKISKNTVQRCSTFIQVATLAGTTTNVDVSGNTLVDGRYWDYLSGDIFHGDGIHMFSISAAFGSVSIYGNNLLTNYGAHSTGAIFLEGAYATIEIYNNLIGTGPGAPKIAEALIDLGSSSAVSATIYNNTIVGAGSANTGGLGLYLQTANWASVDLRNNIFTNLYAGVVVLSTQPVSAFNFDRNNYYGLGNISIRINPATGDQISSSGTLVAWTSFLGGDETNSKTSDPLFVSSSNFSLQAASPAVDAGETLAAKYSKDIIGVDRLSNSAGTGWDMGAYELVQTTPAIAIQPVGVAAIPGGTATFTVGGRGQAPLNYQWRKDGVNIANGGNVSGATTATLTLTSVSNADAGSYSVVVNNALGPAATSAGAALTVGTGTPPAITTQPTGSAVTEGAIVTFTGAATGVPTPSLRWRKDGINLSDGGKVSGATTSTLTLTNVLIADSGAYSFVADNSIAPAATSTNATLTVSAVVVTPPPPTTVAPVITTQPSSKAANLGATVTFTAAASGTPNPTYRWQKNGVNLSDGGNTWGTTTDTLTLTNVTTGDAANYTVTASNGVGSNAVSNKAALTVNGVSSGFLTQPSALTVVSSGMTVTLAVTSSGSPTFQWRKDGVNLANGGNVSGATSDTLTLTGATSTDSGLYTVVATTGTSSVTSSAFEVQVLPASVASQAVTLGHGVTLSGGSVSGSLQWQIAPAGTNNWYNLSDANGYSGTTTNTLQIDATNAGQTFYQYRLVANGSEIVRSFLLTVAADLLRFPVGIAADGFGNLYVADTATDTVFKINSDRQISTLAGLSGEAGSANGTGSAARFNNPTGLIMSPDGLLNVSDAGNATIRQITRAGAVSTLAGSTTGRGNTDGSSSVATFSSPAGIGADTVGSLFLADSNNHTIRRILLGKTVSTFAGTAGSSGNADGTGSAARFNNPTGLAVDTGGNVYVADTNNNLIRKITSTGVVSTLAGVFGVTGSTDGAGTDALFNHPTGLAVDLLGTIYVADTGNSTIRRITPGGVVSTVAGLPGISGLKDGAGSSAWFNAPEDVAVDASGIIYVADTGNALIRRIAAGNVTSLVLNGVTVTPAAPTPPPTTPPPTTPPPPPPSSGSGGGGGAPSLWFVGTLSLLALLRRACNPKVKA